MQDRGVRLFLNGHARHGQRHVLLTRLPGRVTTLSSANLVVHCEVGEATAAEWGRRRSGRKSGAFHVTPESFTRAIADSAHAILIRA